MTSKPKPTPEELKRMYLFAKSVLPMCEQLAEEAEKKKEKESK